MTYDPTEEWINVHLSEEKWKGLLQIRIEKKIIFYEMLYCVSAFVA